MASSVGDLVASLNMNVAPFQSAIAVANQTLVKFDNAVGGIMGNIARPFERVTAIVGETVQQLTNFVNPVEWLAKGFSLLMYPLQFCARQFESIMDAGKAIESFERVENATVRLGAAMKNAGGNIGITMEQMQSMTKGRAGGLESMATLVESGLSGGTLAGAYRSAKDLAATMGTDLPAAANMLGTALEFPERAARSLREPHIKLTESQQEAITTLVSVGDEAGAQAIILAAVQQKTEGVADAMRGTLGGQMREFTGSIEHLSEIFGEALKPTMVAVVDLFKDLATWVGDNKATILAWGETAGNAFRSVTEPLRTFIDLLKGGEAGSAMLYLQLQWEKLKGAFLDGIDAIKEAFGKIADSLSVGASDKVAEFIGSVLQLIDTLMDKLTEKEHDILGFEHSMDASERSTLAADYAASRYAAQHPAVTNALTAEQMQRIEQAAAGPTGGNSEAIAAAQAAYDKSSGAAGLSETSAADQFTKAMQASDDRLTKELQAKKAKAAEARAAAIQNIPELQFLQKPELQKAVQSQSEAHGPSALEKGTSAAWTGIQDAIKAAQGNKAADETAANTKKIAEWCDANNLVASGVLMPEEADFIFGGA